MYEYTWAMGSEGSKEASKTGRVARESGSPDVEKCICECQPFGGGG